MSKKLLTAGITLLALLIPLRASADSKTSYDHIYVFGDSLSDNGNFYKATTTTPMSPPYDQRFSNGPIWAEYLAQNLGPTPTAPIPLTDLAYGGATSGYYNAAVEGASPLLSTGLLSQITNFINSNSSASAFSDPNALFVVWAGANDYILAGVNSDNQTINNISNAVNTLASKGAKNIMVANLPDLGQLPGTKGNQALTNLTNQHNSDLDSLLKSLGKSLSKNSNVNIIELDVSPIFTKSLDEQKKLGFTDVTDSCIGNQGLPVLPPAPYLSRVSAMGSLEPSLCTEHPSQVLFWDSIHPTTAAHCLIGTLALKALKSSSSSVSASSIKQNCPSS